MLSTSPLHLRIFLSSPGDVAEEHRLALQVLEQLPYDPMLRGKVTIETVAWDRPSAGTPSLTTLNPQEAITQGLPMPSECDIVIVILWSRMGTPLSSEWKKPDGSPYRSGTEWEYCNALEAAEQHGKPKLLLYRRTEKILIDPDDPAFEENFRQWRLVKEFFAALRNPDGSIRGGCNEYETPLQFKEDLILHLRTLIRALVPELQATLPRTGLAQLLNPDLRATVAYYLSYLLDRHQYLSLKGMGLSERVPLQLPLLDLYVPFQARLELPPGETWDRPKIRLAGRMLSDEEQEVLTGRLSEPQPVLELLQQRDGLVILGDPGAGKTTFLKYLTLKLARGESAELGLGERLPILAPLSGYANALEKGDIRLDDFIAGYFHDIGADLPLKALLTDALERGAALVLLDGLDEVQDNNLRHLVVERVVDFFTLCRQAGNKFVITSRIISYREVRPVATGLAECTLMDFDDDEIKLFVERWTQALEKQAQGDTRLALADAERERHELLEALERNAGVRQLAANPLLLTILTLVKRQGITLPERRVELYDQYVKTLLSTWNRARGLGRPPSRDLDPVQTVKILAPLALWMHETNPGVGLVKREAMRRELEALYASRGEADPETCTRQFLEDVHDYASLLLERGPGEYGFIHLTFEEYLAAVAIALRHQGDARAIAQMLGAHAGETAWHEIALLTVGYVGLIQQMDKIAGDVVETLCTESKGPPGATTVLAGEAVIDAWPVGVTPASKTKVITALVKILQDGKVSAELRRKAVLILGRLNWLPEGFNEFIEMPAGRYLDRKNMQEKEVPYRFWISKYPVTNAQYAQFIEAGGYNRKAFWSDAGWDWRNQQQRYQPKYWYDPEKNNPIFPVIGVSWYEAEAYSTWFHDHLKREGIRTPQGVTLLPEEYIVRLPSEAEYEYTAQINNTISFLEKNSNLDKTDLPDNDKLRNDSNHKEKENDLWDMNRFYKQNVISNMEIWINHFNSYRRDFAITPSSLASRKIQYSASQDRVTQQLTGDFIGFRLVISIKKEANYETIAITQSRIKVQQFLDYLGARTKRKGLSGFIIETNWENLKMYEPLPLLVTGERTTEQDIDWFIENPDNTNSADQAGVIIYMESPDILVRNRIIHARLKNKFIIIPIPISAIEQGLRENAVTAIFREYVRRYLMVSDPFDDRNAISDSFAFFGRDKLLTQIKQNILNLQNIGIFGLRKAGKTSVLLQIAMLMRDHPIIHIDLQPYTSKGLIGTSLFNKILSTLYSYTYKSEESLKLLDSGKPAWEVASEFTEYFMRLVKDLRRLSWKMPVICLIDEIERILPVNYDSVEKALEFNSFFGTLRTLSQQYRVLSLLVADVFPDCNRINYWPHHDVGTNPVYQFFEEVFLNPFSLSETEIMLHDIGQLVNCTFSNSIIDKIQKASGGHPFLSRQFASMLWKKLSETQQNDQISLSTTSLQYINNPFAFSAILSNYCSQSIWVDLKKRNFTISMDLLRILACNENPNTKWLSEKILSKYFTNTNSLDEISESLVWLEKVGLIDHDIVKGISLYQIRIDLLSQWLRRQMTAKEREKWYSQ